MEMDMRIKIEAPFSEIEQSECGQLNGDISKSATFNLNIVKEEKDDVDHFSRTSVVCTKSAHVKYEPTKEDICEHESPERNLHPSFSSTITNDQPVMKIDLRCQTWTRQCGNHTDEHVFHTVGTNHTKKQRDRWVNTQIIDHDVQHVIVIKPETNLSDSHLPESDVIHGQYVSLPQSKSKYKPLENGLSGRLIDHEENHASERMENKPRYARKEDKHMCAIPDCQESYIQSGSVQGPSGSTDLSINKIHKGEDIKHLCPTCKKAHTSHRDLTRHLQLHTGDKPHVCEVYNERFVSNSKLKIKLGTHTEQPFVCSICNKVCQRSCDLKAHIRTHKRERPFACLTCDQAFKRAAHLKTHERIHTGEKPYACPICEKAFISSTHLMSHRKLHTGERPYECPTCNEKFAQSRNLKIHLRTHTGEQPFVCPTCNKNFNRSNDLKVHLRTHSDDRPFVCSTCNRGFKKSQTLNNHIRTHTGERPFICPTCNKGFSQLSSLKTHCLTHKGEKLFVCPTCKKEFSRPYSLNRHIRIHTGERPYVCPTCNKGFGQAANLKKHAITHEEEKPFMCFICNKKFSQSRSLKSHLKRHT